MNELERQEPVGPADAFRDALKGHVAAANKDITHADFVNGMQDKTIGIKFMLGEPSQLVRGTRKAIFNILVLLYIAAPLILVPLWSYHENNWWLLIGIVLASVIAPQVAQRKGYSAGGFLLFACIVFWLFKGIHNYFTFFSLCALWGCAFFQMAEVAQNEYAMQSLIESPELFYDAVEQNRIMVVRTEDEERRKEEYLLMEKELALLDRADERLKNGDYSGAITEYTKAIETHPVVSAFENRGDARMKLKDYDGAIADYSEAIERMPTKPDRNKFADIYRKRAKAKVRLDLFVEARLDFKEANRLSPDNEKA